MHALMPPLSSEDVAMLCRKYHVRELSLFGSAARGTARPDSDLDFLVEFDPEARIGFLTLASLTQELSDLMQMPVDVVPKDGLKETIRAQVLQEAEIVYAA